MSAYHAFHGVENGAEEHPALYWQWRQSSPFHIDYVFIPEAWVERLTGVEVGTLGRLGREERPPAIARRDRRTDPITLKSARQSPSCCRDRPCFGSGPNRSFGSSGRRRDGSSGACRTLGTGGR